MSIQFAHVELRKVTDSNFKFETIGCDLSLTIKTEQDQECLKFTKENKFIHGIILSEAADCCRGFEKSAVLYIRKNSLENCAHTYILSFVSVKELINFLEVIRTKLRKAGLDCGRSTFDERTDSWSAVQYFQFYSYLSQQQNMMQDYIRTSTYQKAVLSNASTDFAGKIVLDVGAGSGILSFFAIQAGAKRVYAVEASNMAAHCNTLVQSNKLAGRIVVVSGKIEDIVLPEPVDVIISEPMGYMLYNERMLETYVHARKFLAKKHRLQPMHKLSSSNQLNSNCSLDDAPMQEDDKSTTKEEEDDDFAAEPKPGVMFPSVAQLYVVPFSDEALFAEQHTKANFWYQQSFHGMDLSSLRTAAITEYFNQPVVDTFDIGICPAVPCVHRVDFRTVKESELAEINIPLRFHINQCSTIHGLAFWFDVGFLGSQREVWLSTSPTEPLTHWYQVRCLLGTTLFLQEGQILTGTVKMKANTRQSYDVDIELIIPGSDTKICNKLDLKNPHFRYTGFQPAPPPGSHTKPPTEAYYTNCQSVSVDGQQSVVAASVSGVPNQMENMHQYNGSAYIQQGGTPHMFSAGNVAVSTGNNASMMDSGLQVVQDHQSLPLLSPEYVSVATGNAFNSSRHSLCTSTLLPNDGIRSYLNMNPAAMLSGAGDLITNGWPSEHQYLLNQTAVSQPCHFPTRQYPLSDINMARPGS